tara:strand:+ start:335 stop:505 length:171 start_codon:yes stop_codon:yes gene_type:complete
MKSLKKKQEVMRVRDSSCRDWNNIQKLLDTGWNFCSKTTWRKLSGKIKKEEDISDE